jgi:hypothetical protein
VIGESLATFLPVEELSSENCHLYNQWSIENSNCLSWNNNVNNDNFSKHFLYEKRTRQIIWRRFPATAFVDIYYKKGNFAIYTLTDESDKKIKIKWDLYHQNINTDYHPEHLNENQQIDMVEDPENMYQPFLK